MIEKSIKQKIENLKYLKSKFIIENKNGEKDPMFSEGVYSNFDKSFQKILNDVQVENKSYVIKKFDVKNPKKLLDDLANLNYKEQVDDEKENKKIKEYNLEIFENFIKENESKIYKPCFEIDKNKLEKIIENQNELKKTINLIEDFGNNRKFSFDIIKEKENILFSAIRYSDSKEISSNDYITFKKEVFKVLENEYPDREYNKKYDKNYLNNEYKIEIEQDFMFSFQNKRTDFNNQTFIRVDLGKEKFERIDYNILDEVNRILTTKDYVNTYENGREEEYKLVLTPNFYKNIKEVEKYNEILFNNIKKIKETETWEDTMNDIKANIFQEGAFYNVGNNKDDLTDKILDRSVFLFQERILDSLDVDKYLENRLKNQDISFKNELTLTSINNGDRFQGKIKEFLETKDDLSFDDEKYKENIKDFLMNKFDETFMEIEREVIELEEKNPQLKKGINKIRNNFLEKETGIIRKENELLKNALAISIKRNLPNYSKEKKIYEDERQGMSLYDINIIANNYELEKNFKKEMQEKYNINVSSMRFKQIVKNYSTEKFDFYYESRTNVYYNKKTFEQEVKKKIEEKESLQENEIKM